MELWWAPPGDSASEPRFLYSTPSVIGWELCYFHLVALAWPYHPSTHILIHTHNHTGCPRVRQQTLFNLFSSALIGSKLPSWCANECGIEIRPPITPQAHLQDTSGCQAAVCDLYMADEGGGCKVVSTDLDQRDWSWEKKKKNLWVNYCGGSLEAVHVTPTPNEVYFQHPAILEFLWYLII